MIDLLPQLTTVNGIYIVLLTAVSFIISFFFYYPYKQDFYEQQFNKPHDIKDKGLKVVNLYFFGLFKKVVVINLAGKTYKYYINNYFKRRFFRIAKFNVKFK